MMKLLFTLILFFTAFGGTKAKRTINCQMDDEDYCVFKRIFVKKNEFVNLGVEEIDKSQVIRVDFQTSTIESVPAELFESFENLEILLLSKRNVEELRPDTLMHARKLKILDLDRNKISNLERGAFKGAINLENIFLCCNQLTTFDKTLLIFQTKLQYITLRQNNLEILHKDTFKNQINLDKIDLGGNQLQFLHKDIFINNPKLHVLYLNKNKLRAISPKMFTHLKFLQDLWLSQNACINKRYEIGANDKYPIIEKDLKECGEHYEGIV